MQKGSVKKILPIVLILVVSIFTAVILVTTRPQAKMEERSIPQIPVEVISAVPQSHRVVINASGTVVPAKELQISAEVSGRIIEINSRLIPGNYVKKGEVLARIDPRDYEIAVDQMNARYQEATTAFALEKGRQDIAIQEFNLMQKTLEISPEDTDLALRKPQMANVEAAVLSARSSLRQARLNLERTVIRAPFNAIIKTEQVEVGKVVTPQTPLITIIGADTYRVMVNVPVDQLEFISFPQDNGVGGAVATISHTSSDNILIERHGSVISLMSDLSPTGRLARVLVEIDDPLGLRQKEKTLPLLIDAFVNVDIEGPVLNEVFQLPRIAVREDNSVWIMDEDGKLQIRTITTSWRRESDVLVNQGLNKGERIVISDIASPIPGIMLKEILLETKTGKTTT